MTEDLTADEKAEVARFDIHAPDLDPWAPDEPPAAMGVEAFMAEHRISRSDMGELLREYRSESGWSAFSFGDRDLLDSEFLNWAKWERLA